MIITETRIDIKKTQNVLTGQNDRGEDDIGIYFQDMLLCVSFSDRKKDKRAYLKELMTLRTLGEKLINIADTNIKVELKL